MDHLYDDNFLNETLERAFEDERYFGVPKGVVRFDYGNSHGWWVRVTRDKAQFKQLFSDGQYASIEAALRAAILYRHDLLSSFPLTLNIVNSKHLPLESENRIERIEIKGKFNPYIAWKARWYDDNHKVIHRSFSVKKFGEDEAKLLAFSAAQKNHNKKPKLRKIPDGYFHQDLKKVLRSDVEILATINSDGRGSPKKNLLDTDPFAFERTETCFTSYN